MSENDDSTLTEGGQATDLQQQIRDLIASAEKIEPSDPRFEQLRRMGFELFTVQPLTMQAVTQIHPEYFIGGAHSTDHLLSRDLRTYAPPRGFTIAIMGTPEQLTIVESEGRRFEDQLRMVQEYSEANIQPIIPDAHAIMLPATVLAQADLECRQRNGASLLVDTSTYTMDRVSMLSQVTLGRYQEADQLKLHSSFSDGAPGLRAVYGVIVTSSIS